MKTFHFFLAIAILILQPKIFALESVHQKNDKISQTIYLTHGIISCSPEIIKWQHGDRIYFKDQVVEKNQEDGLGGTIHIDVENQLYIPLILSDADGFFTSVSWDFWNKPFHQICNKCLYEWEGGLFALRCPKCRSTDISNILSK